MNGEGGYSKSEDRHIEFRKTLLSRSKLAFSFA